MSTYKQPILYNLLKDLYPDIPVACGTTYNSITLYYTTLTLVPEETILINYPAYVQKYNLSILRGKRNSILSGTDIYGLSDYPFPDDATKQAWITYRKALRSITDLYPNPDLDENNNLIGVVWPTPPLMPVSSVSKTTKLAPLSTCPSTRLTPYPINIMPEPIIEPPPIEQAY